MAMTRSFELAKQHGSTAVAAAQGVTVSCDYSYINKKCVVYLYTLATPFAAACPVCVRCAIRLFV